MLTKLPPTGSNSFQLSTGVLHLLFSFFWLRHFVTQILFIVTIMIIVLVMNSNWTFRDTGKKIKREEEVNCVKELDAIYRAQYLKKE